MRHLRNKTTPQWLPILGLITYIFFFKTYVIFIILFGAAQLQILNDVKYLKPKEKYKFTFNVYILIYKYVFVVSLLLWIIDHILCNSVEFLKFHAFWHMGTGFQYFWVK